MKLQERVLKNYCVAPVVAQLRDKYWYGQAIDSISATS